MILGFFYYGLSQCTKSNKIILNIKNVLMLSRVFAPVCLYIYIKSIENKQKCDCIRWFCLNELAWQQHEGIGYSLKWIALK